MRIWLDTQINMLIKPEVDVVRTMTMELSIEEWELLEAIRKHVNGEVQKKLEAIVKKIEK